eukprot:gene16728-19882_t
MPGMQPPMMQGQYAYPQQPMQSAYPGYPGAGMPGYGAAPVAYVRPQYTYASAYVRTAAFMIPVGLPPHLHAKMYQASAAFRMFDTNCSGTLSKKEFKRCIKHLGYYFSKGSTKNLFYSIDRNYSGSIDEREFCEWWCTMNPY